MMSYKVEVPVGISGYWEVKKYIINEQSAGLFNLRAMINAHRGVRLVEAGEYTINIDW